MGLRIRFLSVRNFGRRHKGSRTRLFYFPGTILLSSPISKGHENGPSTSTTYVFSTSLAVGYRVSQGSAGTDRSLSFSRRWHGTSAPSLLPQGWGNRMTGVSRPTIRESSRLTLPGMISILTKMEDPDPTGVSLLNDQEYFLSVSVFC